MMQMEQKEKVKMMKSNKTTNTKSGKKILKKLYKLLDKLVITPISSVVFKIQKRFGKENNLEKLLNRPYALLFISLFFAIIVSLFVHFKMDILTNNDAEFLTNIPVKVVYNSSAYVFGFWWLCRNIEWKNQGLKNCL